MTTTSTSSGDDYTSKPSRGAASELVACAYLLRAGWHVFRSVSPACPVDGLAYRPGEAPVKFEVKSVNVIKADPTPPARYRTLSFSWPANSEWDVILAVGPDFTTHEFWAPITQEQAVDRLRTFYGFPSMEDRHGTWAGYCAHKATKTVICDPCLDAGATHRRQQRSRKRQLTAARTRQRERDNHSHAPTETTDPDTPEPDSTNWANEPEEWDPHGDF